MNTWILIVDNRGLTFRGQLPDGWETGTSPMVCIKNAQCVIYWGTSHHLAELTQGVTPKTRLGFAYDVWVTRTSIVAAYECIK